MTDTKKDFLKEFLELLYYKAEETGACEVSIPDLGTLILIRPEVKDKRALLINLVEISGG